jgi:MarR family transcriptional regulator, transcriptional regulator for hemolysin
MARTGNSAEEASPAEASPVYREFYPSGTRLEQEFRAMLGMMKSARLWTRSLDKVIQRRTGQTRVRWEMLFAIAFAEGPTTASAIAVRLGVQWPALVRILDALERDGLIARSENPADGRSRLIALTGAGHETIALVRATVDPARAEVLGDLSDAELATMIAITDRLLLRLRGRPQSQMT